MVNTSKDELVEGRGWQSLGEQRITLLLLPLDRQSIA